MKNTVLITLVAAVLTIGGGALYYQSATPNDEEITTETIALTEETSEAITTDDTKETSCPNFGEETLQVDELEFKVAIAKTPEERKLGLGGCPSLDDNEGLYFPFENKRETSFWMKNMLMPIDIIWISDGKVVGIEHNAQPQEDVKEADLPIFNSPQAVDAVLEIAANESKRQEIKVGSEISL